MKKDLIRVVLAGIMISTSCLGAAQQMVRGVVADSASREALAFVNVALEDGRIGTSTDNLGQFKLEVPEGEYQLTFSYVGYKTKTISLEVGKTDLLLDTILLENRHVYLEEMQVISSVAQSRETPVTVNTIESRTIESQLGDQPFPEIMKMVPGVYPTRYGGGSGDARVSIRGFQQENLSLLLNGVPISSVENGLVYWNNWLGLAEATNFIQIQKGLGASRVALNSVGGTINIITKTSKAEKDGMLYYNLTDYGNSKFNLSLSTGKMNNGMAVTFMGSRTQGPGYVDATYVDAWAYFLSVSKEFNKKHKLVFTALGAPERHGQRNSRLSQEEIDRHGIKFNKDWGSYNGQLNNLSENFYHKPHITLNHYWSISERSMLATSAYFSYGNGGGKWSDTYQPNPFAPSNPPIQFYRNPSGQINWEAVYKRNANNRDSTVLANGDTLTGYSINVQTNFLASHVWTGLISTFEHELTENLRVMGGFHYRYFKSKLQQKVRDLLGGDFYIDNYGYAVDGVAGRDQIKHVGDIIKVDNGAIIHFGNIFGEMEYSNGRFSAFLSGSLYNNWFQREDRYNYVTDIQSEVVSMAGFDVKGGANYNINAFHNIYFNSGYFSRVPYYKYVFANFTNQPSEDLRNEKISFLEFGYGFNNRKTSIQLNAYYTYWEDRSMLANEYNQFLDPVMIQGLDALHQGIEFRIRQGIGTNTHVGGLLSLGNWKWKNDVNALVFNDDNAIQDTVQIYADGLYVGDSPQTQMGVFGGLTFLKSFKLDINWLFYDRLFADFNPTGRTDPDDRQQPFELPAYDVLDLHLSYHFTLFMQNALANISCFNALNHTYIVRGEDGINHDLESFRGFWSFGRTFSFSLKIKLGM